LPARSYPDHLGQIGQDRRRRKRMAPRRHRKS
jgi:hypothetical protein